MAIAVQALYFTYWQYVLRHINAKISNWIFEGYVLHKQPIVHCHRTGLDLIYFNDFAFKWRRNLILWDRFEIDFSFSFNPYKSLQKFVLKSIYKNLQNTKTNVKIKLTQMVQIARFMQWISVTSLAAFVPNCKGPVLAILR